MVFLYKKGASQVLEQALIIALVILIVSVIFIFLIPFIKGSFGNTQSCFDVQYKISFIDNKYSCYDSDLDMTGIAVKSSSNKIKEFRVAFYDSSEESTLVDVSDGPNPQDFFMLGEFDQRNAGESNIIVPEDSQQLIYISSFNEFRRVEISPIVNGEICPVSDSVELEECPSSVSLDYVFGLIDIIAEVS